MRADRLTGLILVLGMLLGSVGAGGTAVAQFEAAFETAATDGEAKSPENQPDAAAPAPVPESLSNARATMARFLHQTSHSDYTGAAECLDLSAKEASASEAEKLAYRLKFVLDRLARIDLQSIGDQPQGSPYRFQPNRQFSEIVIERHSSGAWLFDSLTVGHIDDLYDRLKDTPPVAGLDWIQDLFPAALLRPGFFLPH